MWDQELPESEPKLQFFGGPKPWEPNRKWNKERAMQFSIDWLLVRVLATGDSR
jgi:hypothetical protein